MTVGYLTLGQRRARADVQALARTALDVCDILASEAGYEPSDAPRNYLLTVERWCAGSDTAEDRNLSAPTAAMRRWGRATDTPDCAPEVLQWILALRWLFDARRDYTEHPTHAHHVPQVLGRLGLVIAIVHGESDAAGRTIAVGLYKQHRIDVAKSAAQVTRAVQASRAKIDKAEAERLMGTLPGMETGR